MKACLLALFAAVVAAAAPASAASLFFDFGDSNQPTPAASNYNNFSMNPPVGGPVPIGTANAIDSTGAPTGIGVSVMGFFNGSNTTGTATPSGAAAALFHPQATRDNAFGHAAAFGTNPLTPEGTVAFTGLDPSTAYNFTIFAARIGVTDIREAKYVVTGANSGMALLNASGNTSNLAVVSGIFPTAGGTIDLKASPGPNNNSASQFYFLGALELTAVPEPTSAVLAVLTTLALAGGRRGGC